MIDFHTFPTSNGRRVAIMLEECALPYRVHTVNLARGEQRAPAFLRLAPAGMIPVIVDDEGPDGAPITVMQSGAILEYLALKTGRFLPGDARARIEAMQWLLFAVTDCAATSGAIFQASERLPDRSPANVHAHEERLAGLLRVADGRLADREGLAGDYSIADIALYPIVALRRPLAERDGGLANLLRWADAIGARPAVQRALAAGN